MNLLFSSFSPRTSTICRYSYCQPMRIPKTRSMFIVNDERMILVFSSSSENARHFMEDIVTKRKKITFIIM